MEIKAVSDTFWRPRAQKDLTMREAEIYMSKLESLLPDGVDKIAYKLKAKWT